MKRSLFLSLVMLFVIVGCNPVIIDVELPDGSTRMTVNSFFVADSAWSVGVIRGQHVLTPKETQVDIANARVRITEDGQELTTLQYRLAQYGHGGTADNGWYESDRTPLLVPKPGKTYGIIVEADNFPTITASCRLPVPVPITKVEVVSWETDDNSMIPVNVHFTDVAGEENFYEIVMSTTLTYHFRNGETQQVYLKEPVYSYDALFSLPSGTFDFLDGSSKSSIVLFNDTGLDGKNLVVSCRVPYDQFSFSPDMTATYEIILRTLSKEYFQYQSTSILQRWTDGDPFAQPVQVFTNVSDGYGIFAGYSEAVFPME